MAARTPSVSPIACRTMTAPIMSGAEPWSSEGGSHGALVLHGFTGNPQSMRPLAVALGKAGFTVDLPLLPGHGTAVEDMVPTRWEDWSGAAETAYLALATRCEKVMVTGLSSQARTVSPVETLIRSSPPFSCGEPVRETAS